MKCEHCVNKMELYERICGFLEEKGRILRVSLKNLKLSDEEVKFNSIMKDEKQEEIT